MTFTQIPPTVSGFYAIKYSSDGPVSIVEFKKTKVYGKESGE